MKLKEVAEVGFYKSVEDTNVLYEYGKTSDGFKFYVWLFDKESNLYNTDGYVWDVKDVPDVEVVKSDRNYEYKMCLKENN